MDWNHLMRDALISGAAGAAATAIAAISAAKAEGMPAPAPLNAVTHVFWPDQAPWENSVTAKYTGTGVAINTGACVFWAAVYELLFGGKERSALEQALGGAVTAAAAYTVDYHLVPKRLTPGYETRLSPQGLSWIYVALAAALPLRALLERRR